MSASRVKPILDLLVETSGAGTCSELRHVDTMITMVRAERPYLGDDDIELAVNIFLSFFIKELKDNRHYRELEAAVALSLMCRWSDKRSRYNCYSKIKDRLTDQETAPYLELCRKLLQLDEYVNSVKFDIIHKLFGWLRF